MVGIRDRLRKAIEAERQEGWMASAPAGRTEAAEAFHPIREAAETLREELADLPGLSLSIAPEGVWVDFFDRHLWYGYDPARCVFVGSEVVSLWIEGGSREQRFEWSTAEACIDAMIAACARYAVLAEALARASGR